MTIGEKIRCERNKTGLTQATLAICANVSIPHMRNIEADKNGISLEVAKNIVDVLNISLDELAGRG